MSLRWDGLGEWVLDSAKAAKCEVILASPFIKFNTFKRFFDAISSNVPVLIYTRWRVEEIAQGVSDIRIWELVKERSNAKIFLIQNLHSKYYRFDDAAFTGSANITDAGLTWSASSNLETLIDIQNNKSGLKSFEAVLISKGLQVTDSIYESTLKSVEAYKLHSKEWFTPPIENIVADGFVTAQDLNEADLFSKKNSNFWIPVTRSPEVLYQVYAGNLDGVSKDVLVGAYLDLSHLEVPQNLNKKSFWYSVVARLELEPLIIMLDEFLSESRRFGEVRDFLSMHDSGDPSYSWQTIMRWLLFFMPKKYSAKVANYSEIFRKN
jgi:hypothetical protein